MFIFFVSKEFLKSLFLQIPLCQDTALFFCSLKAAIHPCVLRPCDDCTTHSDSKGYYKDGCIDTGSETNIKHIISHYDMPNNNENINFHYVYKKNSIISPKTYFFDGDCFDSIMY